VNIRLKSTLVLVGTIATFAFAQPAQAQYIGDAYGLALNLDVLNIVGLGTVVADTGQSPGAGGGPFTVNLLTASVGTGGLGGLGANTGVVSTSTHGIANVASSFAEVDNLAALPPLLNNVQLTASVVRSDASANSSGQIGSSTITGLHFGGIAISVTGLPNQTVVDLLGNTLVINEQIHNPNGSLTVNALDLSLLGGATKLRVSSSTAGFPTAATPEPGSMALFTGVLVSSGFAIRRRRKPVRKTAAQ